MTQNTFVPPNSFDILSVTWMLHEFKLIIMMYTTWLRQSNCIFLSRMLIITLCKQRFLTNYSSANAVATSSPEFSIQVRDRAVSLELNLHGEHHLGIDGCPPLGQEVWCGQRPGSLGWHIQLRLGQELLQFLPVLHLVVAAAELCSVVQVDLDGAVHQLTILG